MPRIEFKCNKWNGGSEKHILWGLVARIVAFLYIVHQYAYYSNKLTAKLGEQGNIQRYAAIFVVGSTSSPF